MYTSIVILLLVAILITLVAAVVLISKVIFRNTNGLDDGTRDRLKVYEEAMARKTQEDNLVLYAKKKQHEEELRNWYNKENNKGIPPQFRNSLDNQNSPVKTKNSKELIPYGWSDSQKKIWEEFNNS